MSRVNRLINKLAREAHEEIARMSAEARAELQRLAEHHNRSRAQIVRWIRVKGQQK